MNIFVLDHDPVVAAEMQCDKHVVKMVLETAQLLCSPYQFSNTNPPYKVTHYNHPCSKWTRASMANYEWLLKHGEALAREYTYRFGRVHKSSSVIHWCRQELMFCRSPLEGMIEYGTPFVMAMPDQYKVDGNAVQSYRNYYLGDKVRFATWQRGRAAPAWFKTLNSPESVPTSK